MDEDEWFQVLARFPETCKSMRPPASGRDIAAVESDLHCVLPESYRGFLKLHDGGQIGDLVIYGTSELRAFDTETLPRHLIPFHPVTESGDFECFDLSRPDDDEYPVVWYSLGAPSAEATTYMDFTDWFLDHMLDIICPTVPRA